jgi:hypothetical protein
MLGAGTNLQFEITGLRIHHADRVRFSIRQVYIAFRIEADSLGA